MREVLYDSNNGLMTEKLLKKFFNDEEIYQYTISVLKDFKEFKQEVITHLEFLQKQCNSGIQDNDITVLNGINNFITSFLFRNNLIEHKNYNK